MNEISMESSCFLADDELKNELESVDGDLSDLDDEYISPVKTEEEIDHFYSDDQTESSESEFEIEIKHEPISESELIAKDGRIWYSEPARNQNEQKRTENKITLPPGCTRYTKSCVGTIADAFLLFFPSAIERIIIENTNAFGLARYPEQYIEIDSELLRAYFGVLILAGLYRSKNESIEELFNADCGRPIFRSVMSRCTFEYITKVICFDDALNPSQEKFRDKFSPVRNLFDKWASLLPDYYNPFECVTIDEQMLGYRSRYNFRQYKTSKTEIYYLKVWLCVCSKTGYIWKVQNGVDKSQRDQVVLDLVDGLKGHNVIVGKYLSSYELGQKLLAKDITMVGSLRKNKRSIPPKLLNSRKVPLYTSMFAFTDTTTLVTYVGRRNNCVLLQSTLHGNIDVGKDHKKLPAIMQYYNRMKGSGDTIDKILSCYSCNLETNQLSMAVFSNIIDISALNAYVIYLEQNPHWQGSTLGKRRNFLHDLGLALAQPYMTHQMNESNSVLLDYPSSISNPLSDIGPFTDIEEPETKRIKVVPPQLKGRSTCHTCVAENNKRKRYMHQGKCCFCGFSCCKDIHSRIVCVNCITERLMQ